MEKLTVYVIIEDHYNGGRGEEHIVKVMRNKEEADAFVEEKNKNRTSIHSEYLVEPYEVE